MDVNADAEKLVKRVRLTVSGRVQGVGFRPFLWRLARELRLTGFTRNDSSGVSVEIQGSPASLATFVERLRSSPPPLARVTELKSSHLPANPRETDFVIQKSQSLGGQNILVSPDIAICEKCLAEIRDPKNRRFNHPFANCTDCGPRFTITKSLPYDRAATTVACFPLCPSCQKEYENPGDRRFHAQPIACPGCGPKIWFAKKDEPSEPGEENARDALRKTAEALLCGEIVAIKGLGGFQLACDARNPAAVATLRERKFRPRKALAVMTGDLNDARLFCEIDSARAALLNGDRKPIVLCPKAANPQLALAPAVAPDTADIGVMLPYTPLHALLFDELAKRAPHPVLIMTSANPANEPICLGNREARQRLSPLADAWLFHDRDILTRVDDSVVTFTDAPLFLRRARGYAPEPINLPRASASVLGVGAELKTTFCLTRGDKAFLSQHIGDLKSPASLDFYEESFNRFLSLLETRPTLLIRDLHPDYLSSRFAEEYAAREGARVISLQHHAAHAAAVLAENAVYEPALALCMDGSGLGEDGLIRGCELVYMDLSRPEWRNIGSLAPFPLPGGEKAIREPWRVACAIGYCPPHKKKDEPLLKTMIAKGINTPMTTSCGRLFDALASQLDLCHVITYEGQAAVRLETAARRWLKSSSGKFPKRLNPDFKLDPDAPIPIEDITRAAHAQKLAGTPVGQIAAAFHLELSERLSALVAARALSLGVKKVGLGGGVAQNSLFVSLLTKKLRDRGLEPLFHVVSPPGDGGLSLGQAAWGNALLRSGAA